MELSKATMILRGYNYEQVKTVAEVLLESTHVRNMEVTLNTENAFEIIRKISSEFKDRLNIGAGTVQTYEELVQAVQAGATFVLSPYQMTKQMLEYCKEKNVYSIPGSFTPSEIAQSFKDGADCVKVFPANEVSLSYAKKLIEPMGDMKLMAVGGINETNVGIALNSGYAYVGSAGGIFRKEDILSQNKENLKKTLQIFEQAITNR